MSAVSRNGTVYFGYGSNLWKDQMIRRCPTSEYLGIARLNGYRWLINSRGYANVVEIPNAEDSYANETWGLVFFLQPSDEENLDVNEGVPEAYTKENLTVEFWPVQKGSGVPNVTEKPEDVKMLVYIDRKRLEPDMPKKEYIYRMNMGIADAVKEGMPQKYVDAVLRKFIPDVKDETVAKFAQQQALLFEDENFGGCVK